MHVKKREVQQLATKVVPSAEDPELSYNVEDCLEDQTAKHNYTAAMPSSADSKNKRVANGSPATHQTRYGSKEELAIEKKKRKKKKKTRRRRRRRRRRKRDKIALHVSPTAMICALRISAFPVHLTSPPPQSPTPSITSNHTFY